MTVGRKILNFVMSVAVVTVLSTGSLPAFAADKIAVRAGEHKTYGRLVLDWGRAQSYDAVIKDGYLVIHFKDPFEANLNVASRALRNYVGVGEFIDGNRGVRFPLKGNFSLKTAKYGTAIAFDLKKSADTSAGIQVPVRSGDHKDFSRLVFDWPGKTGFSVREEGDTVTLNFDKPGKIQLDRVRRDLPKFVKSIEVTGQENRPAVTVTLNQNGTVKGFRSGNSIAFDFKPLADQTKPNAVAAKVKPVTKVSKPRQPVRKVTPTKQAPVKVQENVEEKVAQAPPAVQEPSQQLKPKPRSLIPEEPEVENVAVAQKITPPSDKMVVKVGKLKDGFRLIFPWKESTAMALFERSENYWMVFDKRINLDFKNISGPYKFLLIRRKQIPHADATVARLTVREGYAPTVTRSGNEWQVDFRLGEVPIIENTVDIQSQPSSSEGARVFIPAVNNGDKVSITDAQVGDEMIAIPLYAPSWGMGTTRTFAQFTVLPSMQGIAMVARDSAVKVAVERNGVSITAAGGLQLSRTISKDDLFAGGDQTDRFTGKKDKAQFVKLDEWAQVPAKDFIEKKQALQRRAARSPKAGRNAARMELAKFFVGHKFYADAFAVLERIRVDDPRADEDAVYRLLRGLSNLGLMHTEEAEADLFHPLFNGIAEIAPWRAKVAAQMGDWKTASREIKAGQDAFGVYDDEFQNEFKLLQAKAALEDYDIELANKALEGVKLSLFEGLNEAIAAEREYLEGLAALRAGDADRAIAKFEQAIAIDHRPIRARAQYAKINAELAQKLITPEEAVDAFNRMSFAWRGDDLELEILKRIGDLQIATGNMGEGLKTFRSIVSTFAKTPQARDIAREMNDIFNQLFLEGGAEELPPIKALALYYEYRELTPLGKKGDRMIRALADRLIKVDLLEQAAQLLDHQVNFRLRGEQKSYTGTKLAVVHLWNENPQESLNILQKTRWRALPDSVKQERLHIQARAYSDLEDYEEALGLLEEDKSKKADLLRADIYWKAKNWGKVIGSLEKLLGESGAAKAKKLPPLDRQRLMQLAVARSLANDRKGIAAMRRTYRKKLLDTPDLDAFDLITEATDGSSTEFRKRSTAIAKISQLESFMAGYREQLKKGEFWATN